MGGLAIAGRFRVRGIAGSGATTTAAPSQPAGSATAQAFGPGGSSGGPPSGHHALSPLTGYGLNFTVAVAVGLGMAWLYWTLPD